MADRAFIYCPHCERQNNQKTELFTRNPEVNLFKCLLGHSFEYAALMAMNPTMIHYEHNEKPGQNDIKAEFWVDPKILSRFREKYPNQQNSTINSILQLSVDGDMIIVSGDQARKLKELGVRTGAEMLARIQVSKTLEAENADLISKLNYFSEMMKGAGVET